MEESDQIMSVVEAVANGSTEALVQSISRLEEASAPSVSILQSGVMQGDWAKAYTARESSFRRAARGSIGKIQESIPSRRFKVLSTRHAPADIERYRPDLVESSEEVLAHYMRLADHASTLVDRARSASAGYMDPSQAVLLESVVGFLESLSRSAVAISREFWAMMSPSEPDGLSSLARMHDLLAESLEDFTIALSVAEKTINPVLGE